LTLPDELRLLGSSTALEISPVALAVARARPILESDQLRVFVGGEGEWDLFNWLMRHAILQAAAEASKPVKVRVALLTPLDRLDASTRADLAAWLDSEVISAVESVIKHDVGRGLPLAELTGKGGSRSWVVASTDPSATRPGPDWGRGDVEVVVRGDVRIDAAYTELTSLELSPMVSSGGNAVHLAVASHGPLPSQEFGNWLLDQLEVQLPAMKGRRADRPVSLLYSDRYFRSPDSPFVLSALVHGLAPPGTQPLSLEIRTAELERGYDRQYAGRDYTDEVMRKKGVSAAFAGRRDIAASTTVRAKSQVDHARTLTATYADGKSLSIQLDQGVDFWTIDPLGPGGRVRPKYPRGKTTVTAWIA
jgi:hypothetical protein